MNRAAPHFSGEFDNPVNESTVRGMKKQYIVKMKNDGQDSVESLPTNARGRPLLLGQYDAEVCDYVRELRKAGSVVNKCIVIAAARGVLLYRNKSLLQEYGGSIELTRKWGESFLCRMGYTKRKGTKTARKIPQDFPQLKSDFLGRISDVVTKYRIPPQLIINWDQTGCKLVPVSAWTMAECGSKQVEIVGLDDKREITVVLACAMSGDMLPPQVLYAGKTENCHAKFNFPQSWDIHHSENHWSNSETMLRYVDEIIIPYVQEKRDSLPLSCANQVALCIFDVFRAHRNEAMLKKLHDARIRTVFVPASCTGELQPLDLHVNSVFKTQLRSCFTEWYSEQVTTAMRAGKSTADPIDLKISTLKPIHAKWLLKSHCHLEANPAIIRKGFHDAGIEESAQINE